MLLEELLEPFSAILTTVGAFIITVGNPCNTNALIAQHQCPDISPTRFSAMTALDENRAIAELSNKSGADVSDIHNLTIWGNHSTTMFPDFENATINGKKTR